MELQFRPFEDRDARFCFEVRTDAFVRCFYEEIGPEAVAAGITAVTPEDLRRWTESMEIRIAEAEGKPVGFVTARAEDDERAEIPFIYFHVTQLGRGYGSRAMAHIESRISLLWPGVNTIFLDTIIPRYNGAFYERMGYSRSGSAIMQYPELEVPAVRFIKHLNPE